MRPGDWQSGLCWTKRVHELQIAADKVPDYSLARATEGSRSAEPGDCLASGLKRRSAMMVGVFEWMIYP